MSILDKISEPYSPALPDGSKQTIYMEPKLSLKAVGQEYAPQKRESTYRKTQPTFHISLEKTPVKLEKPKLRAETPRRRSLSKSKQRVPSDQKDLLKEIANTQERRRHNMYVHNNRRFRNTANSFGSEDYAGDSSKPESMHNFTTAMSKTKTSKQPGNDDLADVSLNKKLKETSTSFKKQRTGELPPNLKKKQSSNEKGFSPQMTNLTQAYTEGVSNLLRLLPFQQPVKGGPGFTAYRKPPIVSSSVELKEHNNKRLSAFQTPLQKPQQQMVALRNQDSGESLHHKSFTHAGHLAVDPSSRKTIKLPFPSKGLRNKDDSLQNSKQQLTSNRSLQQSGYSLHGIHSSIFRVEPVQDYTDLKLDFTSQKHITEYQSTQFIESEKMKSKTQRKKSPRKNQGGPNKVHIKNQAGSRSPPVLQNSLEAQMKLPRMQNTNQNKRSSSPARRTVTKNLTNQSKTSTERKIQTILDSTDYHKLRQHKDPQDNMTNCEDDMCTCLNHDNIISKQKPYQLSQSIDCSVSTDHKSMRMSTSPKLAQHNPQLENLLSIQLRPLKGKAVYLKEYRSMIVDEYGKEKKKQIYETMIPRTAKPFYQYEQHLQPTDTSTAIKLNLRQEKKNEFLKYRRNNHVRLQTISPRGHVEKEEFLKMNPEMAEKMNTTVGSFVDRTETEPTTLRKSTSPWQQSSKKTLKRQFYLFSPQNQDIANQRYAADQLTKDRLSQKSSIVNLEIATSQGEIKKQTNQGNQINLGYVGLSHEQKLANEYFKQLMQDEVQFESMTEMVSHQNMPFGQIYSRMSQNASKVSQQTPKLASVKDERSSIKSKAIPAVDHPAEHKINISLSGYQTTPKQSKNQPKRDKSQKKLLTQPAPFLVQTKISPSSKNLKASASPAKAAPQKTTSSRKVPTLKLKNKSSTTKGLIAAGSTQPTQTTEVTRVNNSSLLKIPIQPAPKAGVIDVGNLDMDLSDHSVSIPRFTTLDGIQSKEMTMYSNPTEVDIQTKTLHQLSQQDWMMRIKRQQDCMETAKKLAIQKEAFMGPLERKKIYLKQQPVNNHKQISQIELIDEFYQQKESFIPEPKLSTSPFLNTGFSNNRYRSSHDVDDVEKYAA